MLTTKWSVEPGKFTVKMRTKLRDKLVKTVNKIFDEVVDRTPVLTGRARACWNISLNEPVYISIPDKPYSVLPKPEKIDLRRTKPFQKIFITNGQPYISKLENGYSNQAPTGMMRAALAGIK